MGGRHPALARLDVLSAGGRLLSYVWYQDMVDFVEGISDDRAGRRLARALHGKGAFRRFKDGLHREHPQLLEA